MCRVCDIDKRRFFRENFGRTKAVVVVKAWQRLDWKEVDIASWRLGLRSRASTWAATCRSTSTWNCAAAAPAEVFVE